jgi:septum formation protein
VKQRSKLLLASGSPRRSELLAQVGVTFEAVVTEVEEIRLPGEKPRDFVRRLAGEKALAGLELTGGTVPVLGADTVVLLDDDILGKPRDRQEAAAMLRAMSGRDHFVLSAVALATPEGGLEVSLNTTRVTFEDLPDDFIEWYCASDEPMDKAGAYAIQGRAGLFVSHVEGSYSGVMGLPLFETGRLLRAAGVLS